MWAAIAAALVLGALLGCKAKVDEPCSVQGDCRSGLICWCFAWGPYECRGKQLCSTPAQVTAACAASPMCETGGLCEAPSLSRLGPDSVPVLCRATAEGCPRWDVCRKHGQCAVDEKEDCVAVADADCKRSTGCKDYGACSLVGKICLPKTDAECAASTRCATMGHCRLSESGACDR